MGREYRILAVLSPVYARSPRPLLYCEDPAVIGAAFYMMERVRGVILRNRLPAGLTLAPSQMRGICNALVDTLVELHAVDYATAGLADLGKPEGYVARQVQGWAQRYERAQTGVVPEMAWTGAWLATNAQGEHAPALIHNDYKLDNLVLDPLELERVIAVLDWEMATIGDPLMDLGTTLGYWMQPGDAPELQLVGLSSFPGALRRSEVVARYAALSGRDVGNIVYYYVFGLFKIAVIAQQIFYRYRQGLTQDPRFVHLDKVVEACARTAQHAATKGVIEG
jgi:aminoglycoside phosphotransferase (APT) family kinase protein